MNSILDVQVSCVPNYFTKTPRTVPLLQWLHSPKYQDRIAALRATDDAAERKRIKASLPAITPSGLFSRVDEQHLIRHSGLLQFDIDLKDNQHIANYTQLIAQLQHIGNVAYCGRSAGGMGWWGLVPIAHPQQHSGHWRYLHAAFARMGICIDEAPKSICSLRGYSYDADAYYNHNAVVLQHTLGQRVRAYDTPPTGGLHDVVQGIITQLENEGRDVTDSYEAWFRIGCCLAASFGEEGRDYFHHIGSRHPQYSSAATNRKYTDCLRYVQERGTKAGLQYLLKKCGGV